MNKTTFALAGGLLLAAGACTDNPAAPSVDRVVAGSQQTLQSLITGFNAQNRNSTSSLAYFAFGDIMARDAIRPDPNEPRWLTEFYEAAPDPSDFVGGAQWTGYYTDLRDAHNILNDASVKALSAGDQAATRGFIRTIEASEYIRIIETHDVSGCAIQGDDPTALPPIKTKATCMAYTSALLDTAAADFAAASATVPFKLPPGFSVNGNYSLTSNLLAYNRSLKGKIEVMRALDPTAPVAGSAATAITALNAALADAPTPVTATYLAQGPYLDFQPAAPETSNNPLVDLKLLLTDNFVNSIQPGDLRANNFAAAPKQQYKTYNGSNREKITDPANSANLTVPLPYFRKAESYLLRAQAEIATGDLVSATRDINVVHTVEGGLPAYSTFTTAAAAINAVLYEYRYSFILQGFQHLDALREYGLLNLAYVSQPGIPSPGPSDALVQRLPIPQGEINARGGNVTPTP